MRKGCRPARRVAASLLLLVLGGCGASERPSVPRPDLTEAAPEVAAVIERLRRDVAQRPDDGNAWGALGDRLMVHGFHREAASAYEEASRRDARSFAWPYRAAWCRSEDMDLEAAAVDIEVALGRRDDHGPAHALRADVLLRLGERDAAADGFRRALSLDGSLVDAAVALAELAWRDGHRDEARRLLEDVLDVDEDHGPALRMLARLLAEVGERDAAEHHARRAATAVSPVARVDPLLRPDIEPVGPHAHAARAAALERTGRLAEAAEEYRKVLELRPESASARVRLGRVLAVQGRLDEAVALWREALARDGDDLETLKLLGQGLSALGRPAEAEPFLRRALELAPGDATVRHELGELALDQGDTGEALHHLREALRLTPDSSALAGRLAWILATHPEERFRDGAEAVRLAEMALDLAGDRDPALVDALAAALAEAGRFEEAAAAAREAVVASASAGDPVFASEIRLRAEGYVQRRPHRFELESPPP